ncbi:hypothetical protein CP557_01510 [Natrinema ejinorense]|uniref:CARDB domain-containing protein n=2 Tax=Natrinema ejinorense TaxID=373386 RepID=A0A2A5QRA9_9EURY|nr:hypothetical protein CP557_01510 [Natrinema ejinorense]
MLENPEDLVDTDNQHTGTFLDTDGEIRNTFIFEVATEHYEFVEAAEDGLIFDADLRFDRTAFGDWVLEQHPNWDKLPDHAIENIFDSNRWDLADDASDTAVEFLVSDMDEPPVEAVKGQLLEIGSTTLNLRDQQSATTSVRVKTTDPEGPWESPGVRLRFGHGSTDWSLSQTLSEANSTSYATSWSPNGSYLAYGEYDGNVYVHSMSDWSLATTLSAAGSSIEDIGWAPDSSYIAYGSTDDNVYIHSVSDWGLSQTLSQAGNSVYGVDWSPDGNYIAYGSTDNNVYIHATSDWSPIADSPLSQSGNSVYTVAWSADSSYISYGTSGNSVHVHTTNDWSPIADSPLSAATGVVRSIDWEPNTNYVAYGSDDENVYIHATSDWSPIANSPLTQATRRVTSVAWSPDASYLAYGSYDSNTYVHLTSDWTLDVTLTEASGSYPYVNSVTWAPGTDNIAYTGASDLNTYVHNAPSADFVVTVSSTNSPIDENETLTVDTQIDNQGGKAGEQEITLEIGGTLEDSQTVSLDASTSTTIVLEWPTEVGDHGSKTATVSSNDDSDSTSVLVRFDRTVTATGSGSATVSREWTSSRSTTASGTGSATISRTATADRSLLASGTGGAAISRTAMSDRTVVATGTGSAIVRFDFAGWAIGRRMIQATEPELSPKTLSLSFEATRDDIDHWRQFDRAGDVGIQVGYGGQFRAIDSAGRDNPTIVEAPDSEQPPFQAGSEWYINSYEEEQVAADRFQLTLTFQRLEPRSPAFDPVDEAGGFWTIDTNRGTIALEDRQVGQVSRSGTTTGGTTTLPLRLTPEQAAMLADTATVPDAVVERIVPDGPDRLEDSSNGQQTVTITAPSGTGFESGDYLLQNWSLSHGGYQEHRWRVDLEIAER